MLGSRWRWGVVEDEQSDCQTTATQNLAAGAHLEFTMFGTAPRQPGPISMTVTADPIGAVPEADETDNQASAGLTGVTLTAPAGYACTAVTATTVECSPTSTQSLAVGASVAFVVDAVAPTTPGDLTVTTTADPLGAVPEADESDNTAASTVTAT